MVVEEKDPSHVLLKPLVRPVTVAARVEPHERVSPVRPNCNKSPVGQHAAESARAQLVTGPLQWQPGDKYQYGNQGMNIAARIVEIVSGWLTKVSAKDASSIAGDDRNDIWPSELKWPGSYGLRSEQREKRLHPGRPWFPDEALQRLRAPLSGSGRRLCSPPRTTFSATASCWPTTANWMADATCHMRHG